MSSIWTTRRDSFVRALDEPMPEEMVRLLESEPIWK